MKDTAPAADMRTDDVRERLLRAAETLFLDQGFLQTSIDAIVRGAATSKREFYRYFENKEAIFLEVASTLIRYVNPIFKVPQGKLEETLPPLARHIYLAHLDERSLGALRASIAARSQSKQLSREVYLSRAQASEGVARYLANYKSDYGLVFGDPLLTALRFGFYAIDGLRFMMGAPRLDIEEQDVLATTVTDLFFNGYASAEYQNDPECIRARLSGNQYLRVTPSPGLEKPDAPPSRLPDDAWDALDKAAWDDFTRHDYLGASLGRIARATGISRPTIYRRYPSKEDLFLNVAASKADTIFPTDLTLDWDRYGPVEQLNILSRTILEAFLKEDNVDLHMLLITNAHQEPAHSYKIYDRLVTKIIELITPAMLKMIENGVLMECNPRDAAWRFYILSTFGARFLFVPPQTEKDKEHFISEAVDFFLFGVRKPNISGPVN